MLAFGPGPVVGKLELLHSLDERAVAVEGQAISNVKSIRPLDPEVRKVIGGWIAWNIQSCRPSLCREISRCKRLDVNALLVPPEPEIHKQVGPECVVKSEGIALRPCWSRPRVAKRARRPSNYRSKDTRRTLVELRESVTVEETQVVAIEIVRAAIERIGMIGICDACGIVGCPRWGIRICGHGQEFYQILRNLRDHARGDHVWAATKAYDIVRGARGA